MKVLFLDIDGVVNSIRSAVALDGYPNHRTPGEDMFDEIALALIRKLCKETKSKVVLSSTWRHAYNTSAELKDFGKRINLPIVGKTPRLSISERSGRRGSEIKWYLDETKHSITKYAIVDDDSDMLDEQKPYFVQTSNMDGLSYKNYIDLKELLK